MKVNPYFFAGIGSRPWTTYEIADQRLTIRNTFSGNASMPLPPASVEAKQTLLQKATGIGDLIVRDKSGKELTCIRLSSVQAFIDALYANNSERDSSTSVSVGPAWHEGLSDDDLEDFAVIVSPLPLEIEGFIWRKSASKGYGSDYGVLKKWTKAGERMTTNTYDAIIAPADGQFFGTINALSYRDPRSHEPEFNQQNALCFFVPRKGHEGPFTAKDFHDLDDPILRIFIDNFENRTLPGGVASREALKAAYDKFRTEPLKTVSVSSLPKWDRDLLPERFATPPSPDSLG